MPSEGESIQAAKARLRSTLIAARRARSEAERQDARRSIAAHLRTALTGRSCIAAYLPLATEPLEPNFVDELAQTFRVLIPVVTGSAPLDWCEHPGPVRRGDFGIDEPTGPRLGAAAIKEPDVIIVPALAVDPLGHRLGRGGGHYDRTLALLSDADLRRAPRMALLYDEEFGLTVPFDELDRPVSAVVTPTGGVQALN